ncbi:amidohydrolase family protein [Streptomyces sp. SID4934]|uniref:Amidohydrolase n=1 Tax=Streptomyces wadayamensis TaxID=141454 RepID=A0ABR4S5Q4_9ACTN|nr:MULTISPECIES: amidohydrolase family protein [Streptomyces]MYQ74018.1 amidohydrolase family protein [Streptomyces sp. SID4934]KDR60952.1 amidohydrolase [Streptomyces wadayamensis]QXQ25849.1 amidohydrolase family protein [Streptomyces albidoflavus]QXQ34803.1 amidohydrolase family protein [Streptomyces albidoflavus]SCE35028.1 Imidazolonepropionase [Streptomyces sp. ScaeMP-6W]
MLITASRVVTGTGEYLENGAVLVDGELIAAVGPRGEVEEQAPADVPRFDFAGTVLPGLIDAHVHLAFDGGADPVEMLQESTDDQLLDAMRQRAEQLLLSGVTTARDLGDRNGLAFTLAAEIEEGRTPGPRLVAAGAPVTSVGGHCHFLGGEVSGAGDARELVRRNLEAGAGVIKVMVSGGGLTKGGPRSWENQLTAEEIGVVVAEAHEAGVPVAAHAHGADAIAASVAAGVDTIEHCTWMTDGGLDLRYDVLRQIIEQDIAVCPAVSPHWRMLPAIFGEQQAAAMFDLIRKMADAGARLIAGTDAGVQRAGFDGLASSMAFYSHLGVETKTILDMATSGAAEALGLGSITGRVAPGYRADLLVVDGDPLADLVALREARAVVAAGRMHVHSS